MSPKTDLPRVLYVDDEEMNLRTFFRVFRSSYDLLLASGVDPALEFLSRSKIVVAFVDYAMPGKNGIDLLRIVAQHFPKVGRVLVTAHNDLPQVLLAKQQGLVADIIRKPWAAEKINDNVEYFMHPEADYEE